MSSLYVDTNVDVVKWVLKKRDASGSTVTYYTGIEAYASGALYTSSPVVYPVLAAPPVVQRSIQNYSGVRHNVTIQLFGKAALDAVGLSFFDLFELYEIHGAAVTLLYYAKPRDAATTHTDSVNIREVLEVLNYSYDDSTGILTIAARDTWFKDKDFHKHLTGDIFSDLSLDYEGDLGGTSLGQTTATYTRADGTAVETGTLIPAPVIENSIDGSSRPTCKVFAGWTYPSHPNNSRKNLFVANPYASEGGPNYLDLYLPTDPQTAWAGFGGASAADAGESYFRFLSYFTVGHEFDMTGYSGPGGSGLLSAIEAKIKKNPYHYCATFNGTDQLFRAPDGREFQILGDGITISGWFYLSSKAASATLIRKFYSATVQDYWLKYDQPSDRFTWTVYDSTGASLGTATANTLGSPSTGTWYYIEVQYDPALTTAEIRIKVNNGSADTANSAGTPATSAAPFTVGGRDLSGRIQMVGIWSTAYSTSSVYNSGNGKAYTDLTDSEKEGLEEFFPLSNIEAQGEGVHSGRNLRRINSSAYTAGKVAVTISAEDGELACRIYKAVQINSTWQPDGRVIAEAQLDMSDAGIQSGGTVPFFQFHPPVAIANDQKYFAEFSWSGRADPMVAPIINISSTGGGGYRFKKVNDQGKGWTTFAGTYYLDVRPYLVGKGDDDFEDGTSSGTHRYSYHHLEAKSITLTGDQERAELGEGLSFLSGVYGLEDDGSGTYTGSAGAVISNPADLVRFLLMSSDPGMGLTSSEVDTSSLSTARTACSTAGLVMGFSIIDEISVRDLILEICRQGRLAIYKTRAGKLAVYYPTPISSWSVTLNEAVMRGDLMLLSAEADDESNVVNDFKQLYAPDLLNGPKDVQLIRRAQTDKYSGVQFTNGTDSTDGDTLRETMCANSQTLFGRREHRAPLDFYDTAADVRTVQNYYLDRFAERQRRFVVRVPRKSYYSSVELFTTVRLDHSGLQESNGTGFTVRKHNDGSGLSVYDEGIPVLVWSGGRLEGWCVGLTEQGPYLSIECVTVSPFSAL